MEIYLWIYVHIYAHILCIYKYPENLNLFIYLFYYCQGNINILFVCIAQW